jgi:hypothetical protein
MNICISIAEYYRPLEISQFAAFLKRKKLAATAA